MLRNKNKFFLHRSGFLAAALLLLMNLCFSSCGSKVNFNDLSPITQEVIVTEEGVFRGIDFDMNIDEVTLAEPADLLENDNRYLYYEVILRNDTYTEIEYLFDAEGKLDRIICNLHVDSIGLANKIFGELAGYFDTRFGARQKNLDDFKFWEFDNSKINNGKIELSLNQINEDNSAQINIEFYHRLHDDEDLET